jgi:hypothetical protein
MLIHRLFAEIDIAADRERVWAVLCDFGSYSDWNPFIVDVGGEARPGTRIAARVRLPRGIGMSFKATVLTAEEGRELRWIGRLPLPGIFEGEHRFLIEPIGPGRVRFAQSEDYKGLLVPLMRGWLERDIRPGFAAMNTALKVRAELRTEAIGRKVAEGGEASHRP